MKMLNCCFHLFKYWFNATIFLSSKLLAILEASWGKSLLLMACPASVRSFCTLKIQGEHHPFLCQLPELHYSSFTEIFVAVELCSSGSVCLFTPVIQLKMPIRQVNVLVSLPVLPHYKCIQMYTPNKDIPLDAVGKKFADCVRLMQMCHHPLGLGVIPLSLYILLQPRNQKQI